MNVTCGIKVLDGSSETSFSSGKEQPKMPSMDTGGWFFYPEGLKKVLRSQALHLPQAPDQGLIRMLSGPEFDGIGEETAKKIVTFGCANVLRFLDDDSINLTEELSVSENIDRSLREGWDEDRESRYLKLLLMELGFSNASINFVLDELGAEIIEILIKRPYSLIGQVPRLSFEEVHLIVSRLNLEIDPTEKIIAGIHYCLHRVEMQRGHTAAPLKRIKKDLESHFSINDNDFQEALDSENNQLITAEIDGVRFIQSQQMVDRDQEIAVRVSSIVKTSGQSGVVDLNADYGDLPNGITLSDEQKEVLHLALKSSVSVITGGPGTGKTSIVLALLKALEAQGKTITVCAPTGRAAKRLAETQGMKKFKPSTIHMMLARNPKKVDVLVIDEASMIDADLMLLVCGVLNEKSRLILIGDVDQLPPVKSGQVFKDLIQSAEIPVGRLTKIFRQQSGSDIVSAARSVINGEFPKSGDGKTAKDFSFIEEENDMTLEQQIIDLYLHKLPRQLGIDPIEDIQILSPMRKGSLGIDNLNQKIQSLLRGRDKPLLTRKFGPDLHKGDKIIQTKNNYEKGVMNGDTGYVIGRNKENFKLVFDGKVVNYSFEDLNAVQLAYAISIHKSQGSEYPAVIIPISMRHQHMLGRNLIYTAITRGKERVIVSGNRRTLSAGIQAEWKDFRYSLLGHWLRQAFVD